MRKRAKEISLVALFISLMVVGAQISIPIGPVPITLQVLMLFLTGYILNPKLSFLTELIYLAMGAVGLPVFANFTGGIVHLLGPTGGYLISFPLVAYIVSLSKNRLSSRIVFGFLALVLLYGLGVVVLSFHIKSIVKAFTVGVFPFIPIDIGKMFLAIFITTKLKKIIPEVGKA
ncbi:biotin transporter BioY [Thermosipho ferrireducens]|uniref:Biotin transporter n=1 Tax=Thermosipho ferrireducens TaxID=2571116 RepID=A0ABX7S5N0_9BACT|nr:biotin transporter BioY [Thermosipho ferrireducens]QTA37469.1 biotin transporter BioY [Thermosipho ferrireducens]